MRLNQSHRIPLVFKLVLMIAFIVTIATGPIIYLSYQDSVRNATQTATTKFTGVLHRVSESSLMAFTHTQMMVNQIGQLAAGEATDTLDLLVDAYLNPKSAADEVDRLSRMATGAVSGIYKADGTEVGAHPYLFGFLAQDPIDNHGRHISYYLNAERLLHVPRDVFGLVRVTTGSRSNQPFFFIIRPLQGAVAILFYDISMIEDRLVEYMHFPEANAIDVVKGLQGIEKECLVQVTQGYGTDSAKTVVRRLDDKQLKLPELPASIFEEAKEKPVVIGISNSPMGEVVYGVEYVRILDWHIVSMIPFDVVKKDAMQGVRHLLIAMLAAFGVAVALGIMALTRFLEPLNKIFRTAKRLIRIDFSSEAEVHTMKEVVAGLPPAGPDEIGRLSGAFGTMVDAVVRGFDELRQTLSKQHKLEGELNAAHNIQMSILPSSEEEVRSAHFVARTFITPAREVGGDFFDVFEAPDGRQAVVMGDVSGKGVSAALFMCVALTLVRGAIGGGLDPAEVLKLVNDGLAARNPTCMFATLWIGLFDPKTGRLEYSNGAHCAPAVLSKTGEVRWIENVSGLMVGPMADSEYTLESTQLEDGDLCLLYTDGVSEAMNAEHELFSAERIESTLRSLKDHDVSAALQAMMDAILAHRGDFEQSDDIAMLAFRYDAQEAAGR